MPSTRYNLCVLCSSRPKVRDRRPLFGQKKIATQRTFLHQIFFIEHYNFFNPGSVFSNKCGIRCSRKMNAAIGHSKKFTRRNLNTFHQPTKQNRLLYHSQCAVNLRCGPKLAVVATRDRHNLFLEKRLIIWCPGYLSDNLFYTIATEKKTNPQSRLTSWFNY